jgi:hypothetical protein
MRTSEGREVSRGEEIDAKLWRELFDFAVDRLGDAAACQALQAARDADQPRVVLRAIENPAILDDPELLAAASLPEIDESIAAYAA